MPAHDDAIAAIATAPGAAGLAVVRVSGAEALTVADAVFRGPRPLGDAAPNTLHHGWAAWPDRADPPDRDRSARAGASGISPRLLDEVVAAVFRAPHSYTREDVVELSCHGGRLPAQRVLAALLRAGARLARPGEFTLRAFLNGRLDLVQAEAVADLIHAESEAARELALSQLAGALSRRIAALEESLRDALAEVEARIDFAEDVGGIEVPAGVVSAIEAAAGDLETLLEGSEYARAVREGVRVVLVGRPNVGKSSLFNALLGAERAIVSPLPGTTRDLVSERIEIAGVPVTLVDAAGWREGGDVVEVIGVERARAALDESSVALWVLDQSVPLGEEDRRIAARIAGKRTVAALNKSDRAAALDRGEVEALFDGAPDGGPAGRNGARPAPPVVEVSALLGRGLEALREAIAERMGASGPRATAGAAVANPRHVDSLARARASLARAALAAANGSPGEIVALELRECLGDLGELSGRAATDDLLDRIFSRFCVGK